MRGLPWGTKEGELKNVFHGAGFNVSLANIFLDYIFTGTKKGMPSGSAFIVFQNENTLNQAIKELDRATIGDRYMELFPVERRDIQFLDQLV